MEWKGERGVRRQGEDWREAEVAEKAGVEVVFFEVDGGGGGRRGCFEGGG